MTAHSRNAVFDAITQGVRAWRKAEADHIRREQRALRALYVMHHYQHGHRSRPSNGEGKMHYCDVCGQPVSRRSHRCAVHKHLRPDRSAKPEHAKKVYSNLLTG